MSERPPRPTPDSSSEQEERPRLELSPIQIAGSALAATSAAVVSSFFGTAGTLAGAALVSVVATTGNAVYTHSLRSANARLRDVARTRAHPRDVGVARGSTSGEQATARRRLERQSPAGSRHGNDGHATGIIDVPYVDDAGSEVPPTRWRLVVALSAGVFVIALAVVLGVELLGGKPMAALVRGEQGSGTTIGHHVVVNKPKQDAPVQPTSSPSPSATSSASPSADSVPSSTPTSPASAQPTPSAGSTDAPTSEPTTSNEPSPSSEPTSTSDPTGAIEAPSAGISPPPAQ